MPWVHRLQWRGDSMAVVIPVSVLRHPTWKNATHVAIDFEDGTLVIRPLTDAQLRTAPRTPMPGRKTDAG